MWLVQVGNRKLEETFSPFSSIILSVVNAASPEHLPSFNWTQNKSKVSVAAEKSVSVWAATTADCRRGRTNRMMDAELQYCAVVTVSQCKPLVMLRRRTAEWQTAPDMKRITSSVTWWWQRYGRDPMCWCFSYTIIVVLSRVSAATDQSHCLDIQLALANELANAFKNYQYQTNTSNLNLANGKPNLIL